MTDQHPASTFEPRMLYQVRVPVVFDHLNDPLRQQLGDREIQFKQLLGRGVTIAGDLDVGKFEVWFEVNRESGPDGRQDAAESAIGLVETALEGIGGVGTTPCTVGIAQPGHRDRGERRLIPRQRLLDAVRMQPGDVAAVRGVLDRGPLRGCGPAAQVATGGRQLQPPALAEGAQGLEQPGVDVRRPVEATGVTVLVDPLHWDASSRR